MKIWVIKKRTGIICAVAFALVLSLIWIGRADSVSVSGTKRDLPVYCVDKGEEKVMSLSFDAACPA